MIGGADATEQQALLQVLAEVEIRKEWSELRERDPLYSREIYTVRSSKGHLRMYDRGSRSVMHEKRRS